MTQNYHIESIEQVNIFFDRLLSIVLHHHEPNSKELQKLHYWLDDAHAYLCEDHYFVNVGFGRLVNTLSHICNMHENYAQFIHQYLEEHPHFVSLLMSCSRQNFNHFRSQEFCNFLNSIAHLHIIPPEDWLEDWFACTFGMIVAFNERDFVESIFAISLLKIKPPEEWMEQWFLTSQIQLKIMDPIIAAKLLLHLSRIQRDIPQNWLNDWCDAVLVLLPILDSKDLFELSEAFSIKCVSKNEKIIDKWLQESSTRLFNTNAHYIVRSIFILIHNDINIPEMWINLWYRAITCNISELNPTDLINVLYSMCLRQEEKVKCDEILRLINNYFTFNLITHISLDDLSGFRKLIIAQRYFEIIGCHLNVDVADYITHLNQWIMKERIQSVPQQIVTNFIQALFPNEIVQEAFVDCICDCVDVYVPEHQLIIEIDGNSHYLNGHLNAITALKNRILSHHGYHVVRLHITLIKSHGTDYILQSLLPYTNQPATPSHICLNRFNTIFR